LEYVPRVPVALPADAGIVYYAVKRHNPFWTDVFMKKTLALRFSPVVIKNKDAPTGSEELIVLADGYPQANLRFTLFAVPRPTTG
jgi:hypothetical protein